MEEFKSYGFSDFLSDPDFRRWVKDGSPETHPVWGKIVVFFPEKAEIFRQAVELVEELLVEEGNRVSADELEQEVQRILGSTSGKKVYSIRPGRWYWAAAVLLGGMMLWFLKPQRGTLPPAYEYLKATRSAEIGDMHNPSDSVKIFQLPDGSLARLYPGARLKYLVAGFDNSSPGEPKREVYMTGDIFFEVEKDTIRPFIVYTDGFLTRVVGTSFLIRSSGEEAYVEVKSGKVVVRSLMADEEEEIALTPNQKATYSTHVNQLTKELSPEPVLLKEVEEPIAFDFEGTPVEEVFARLEKAYGIPIRFDADKLQACFLSVRMGNEPFYAKLEIVCKTIGAGFRVEDGEVMITGEGCR